MNTKIIKNTSVKSLPKCPPLSTHKQSKVITKHFTNAAVYLPKTELSLFNWLIYQSDANNSFTYSTQLLRLYRFYLIEMSVEYKSDLPTAIQILRKQFIKLVEGGYILPYKDKHYLNPMFVISRAVNKKRYKEFVISYQSVDKENYFIILKLLLNL